MDTVHGNKIMLLALDLGADTESLIERVRKYYFDDVDNLHVVHVIRHGLHDSGFKRAQANLDPHIQRQRDHLNLHIRELLHRRGLMVPPERIHLICGEPAWEIKRLAADIGADLVIVGSHCKQEGWLNLPGATTNCVIQGIASDVIAVKL